jgi:putative membrane protein
MLLDPKEFDIRMNLFSRRASHLVPRPDGTSLAPVREPLYRKATMLKPISVLAALSLLTGCAGNDTTSDNNRQNDAANVQSIAPSNLSIPDRQFINDAAIGGMSEVQAGQIAMNRSTNDSVKQFGQQMVTDHKGINSELTQLAQQKGITPPTYLDTDAQATIDKLNSVNSNDFDETYITGQVKSHTEAVGLFEMESKSGQDADLKAFASQYLPTLQHHLEMIKDIQSKAGSAGSPELNKRPENPNNPVVPPNQSGGNDQSLPQQTHQQNPPENPPQNPPQNPQQ